jgi:hypothetical protein
VLASAWAVFLLFTVPIGGGIPAGVLLAQKRGLSWPAMSALYFLSDVCLALVFEPLMHGFIALGKKMPVLGRIGRAMGESTRRAVANYGTAGGPLSLVLVAFGVDPMTGRAAAHAAGHGFLAGWAIAITGDMFYFWVIMASTLWLRSVLGDGTKAMAIVLVLMLVVPELIRRWREKRARR